MLDAVMAINQLALLRNRAERFAVVDNVER